MVISWERQKAGLAELAEFAELEHFQPSRSGSSHPSGLEIKKKQESASNNVRDDSGPGFIDCGSAQQTPRSQNRDTPPGRLLGRKS